MTTPLLLVERLRKEFGGVRLTGRQRGPNVRAVDDVTFDVAAGETLALVGESGCGKTTLGRCIARIIQPDSGRIVYDGRDIAQLSRRQLRDVRGDIQVVFQDVSASLNPRRTVGKSIALPLRMRGNRRPAKAVEALLERVGLSGADAHRYPHQFSGGQRQRINIARALAPNPRLIICDEPASSLDVSVQAQICNLLRDLQEDAGTTYLFISHDLALVRAMADRIAVMYLGRIVELAGVDRLFASPLHPYTHSLLAAVPGQGRARRQARIQGEVAATDASLGCAFAPRCPHATELCHAHTPPLVPHSGGTLAACHHAEHIQTMRSNAQHVQTIDRGGICE